MYNQKGSTLPILMIIVAIIVIIGILGVRYGLKLTNETKLQDIRTDMLLIQAESKKDLEEVRFQTANLDKNKEEDLAQINEIKKECLKGVLVQGSEVEQKVPEGITIDENCYYLNDEILKEIGVKNLDTQKYGYFIVKYDFDNTSVEVINTQGYNGRYTLTDLTDE